MSHKCSNCNAELRYVDNENVWVCDYCRARFNNETLNSYKVHTCKKCKLEFITDVNSNCPCCNSNFTINDINEPINIDSYIPFKISKEDSIKKYKEFCNSNIAYPFKFKKNKVTKKIREAYIPVVITNYICSGEITSETKKISEWKSGNYNYKKTDIYDAVRNGTMNFENIPISCNNRILDNIIEDIHPYNYKELNKFNILKEKNFTLYNPNIKLETIEKESSSKVKNLFLEIMKNDITGYNQIKLKDKNISLKSTDKKLVLLPVYIIVVKYKKQLYQFFINGQTGKISGSIPTSKFKIFNMWFSLFIIFAFIMFLLEYLKVI